jgi:hypothetical protein
MQSHFSRGSYDYVQELFINDDPSWDGCDAIRLLSLRLLVALCILPYSALRSFLCQEALWCAPRAAARSRSAGNEPELLSQEIALFK